MVALYGTLNSIKGTALFTASPVFTLSFPCNCDILQKGIEMPCINYTRENDIAFVLLVCIFLQN